MEIAPGTVIDRYTVEAVLGEGGMAVVYKVRHNTLGSQHALKVLTITSPELKKRLVQEGRLQGQLRHPNIVQVTDVVEVGDAPALVMEFIEGPTLDDYIENQRPTLEQADALAQGILHGVAAAHAKGLVHRDLKPGNVLLQVSANGLTPKITDFGLAKVRGAESGGWTRTREGTAMGTPHYMSPEQIRDAASVGEPGDVFALGAILYELVCGKRAFDGDDILEIFNNVAHAKYRPLKELVPDAPERITRAIAGALQERIEDRLKTVTELHAVWNGERLGPWDPKTLDEVVARLPPAARARTALSIAPFTRYTAGTLMGGGVLLAAVGLLAGGFAIAVAVGLGLWSAGFRGPSAEQTPPTHGAAMAEAPPPGSTVALNTDPDTLPFVGPLPSETQPEAASAGTDGAGSRVANPWATSPSATATASPSGLAGDTAPERMTTLEKLASDPSATWAIGDAMKNDADLGVRKKASKLLIDRWDGHIGSPTETGLLVGWIARNGAADLRADACAAIGRQGTSLSDLTGALNDSAPSVRRAAVDGLVAVAQRTGQRDAAAKMLQDRLPTETDGKVARRLAEALKSLN